jgi:DNA gyrase subunit A
MRKDLRVSEPSPPPEEIRPLIAQRLHVLDAMILAHERWPDVASLIARSENDDAARLALQDLLAIDEVQATTILDMQMRRLTEANVSRVLADATECRRELGH